MMLLKDTKGPGLISYISPGIDYSTKAEASTLLPCAVFRIVIISHHLRIIQHMRAILNAIDSTLKTVAGFVHASSVLPAQRGDGTDD